MEYHKRWVVEIKAYEEYLGALEFVVKNSRGAHYGPDEHFPNGGSPHFFIIGVKPEYYGKFDAKGFKFEDFKPWVCLNGVLLHHNQYLRADFGVYNMVIVLKEGGVEKAEAAAAHFASLPFINQAFVNY